MVFKRPFFWAIIRQNQSKLKIPWSSLVNAAKIWPIMYSPLPYSLHTVDNFVKSVDSNGKNPQESRSHHQKVLRIREQLQNWQLWLPPPPLTFFFKSLKYFDITPPPTFFKSINLLAYPPSPHQHFFQIPKMFWHTAAYPPPPPTISNTRATFAYHSFYDNLRLHVPLRHFLIVCYCFCTILNYYVLSKSDVIKITCTHSMAMVISDGLNWPGKTMV